MIKRHHSSLRKRAFLALGNTGNQEAAGYFVEKLGDREYGATAREGLKENGGKSS